MLIPYKMGTSLLKKTAALTWAVEHALAGWDAGKFVIDLFLIPFALFPFLNMGLLSFRISV